MDEDTSTLWVDRATLLSPLYCGVAVLPGGAALEAGLVDWVFSPLRTFWFFLISTWCKDFPFHRSSVLAQWCSEGEGYPGKEMLYRPAQSLWSRSESEQNEVLTYFSPPLTFADNVSPCISSNACFCRRLMCCMRQVVKQENLPEVSPLPHLSVCHVI